jgi:hypothetical protein
MTESIVNRFCANLSDKTEVSGSGFGSSNSIASFVKFQNCLFTLPLGNIKGVLGGDTRRATDR